MGWGYLFWGLRAGRLVGEARDDLGPQRLRLCAKGAVDRGVHPSSGAAENLGYASDASGAPKASTLVSVFCVPPSSVGSVDALSSLPGPGAVALQGKLATLP